MLSGLKNKRKAWLAAGLISGIQPLEVSLEEIRKKQMLIDRTEKMQRVFWSTVPNSLGVSNFKKDDVINLETYREDYFDETEVLVFPKNSSSLPSSVCVLDDQQQSKASAEQLQSTDCSNDSNMCTQKIILEEDIKVKTAEEIVERKNSSSADTSFIKDQIECRLQQIISRASQVPPAQEEDKITVEKEGLPNVNGQMIAKETEVLHPKKQKEPSVVIEEQETEILEDESRLLWQTIQKKEDIPSQYSREWAFKGIEELVLDKDRKYLTHEIFLKYFTEEVNSYILSCVFQKMDRKREKRNSNHDEERVFNITPYEIDALIALILHFKCIKMPNKINLIMNEQVLMEKDLFEKLIHNFSIGRKERSRSSEKDVANETKKISGFIDIINSNFKQIFHPSETLVSTTHRFDGVSLSKDKSDHQLQESKLTESTQSYILDLQFQMKDKLTDKKHIVQSLINQFNEFTSKNHKVIVLYNEGFEIEQIAKLKQSGVGVVTVASIDQLQLSEEQLKRTKMRVNQSKPSAFFISGGEVLCSVTQNSRIMNRGYISTCEAAPLSQKEFRHPKMERVFLGHEKEQREPGTSSKYLSGVKWDCLVFLRTLDSILTNCTTVMNHLQGGAGQTPVKIKKSTIANEIIDFLMTRYKQHRVLQQKICSSQVTHGKDIRVHFNKELPAGSKKIECIVCAVKTRSYCVQCTETKRTQIGFCGSQGCLEKHNDLPAKLLMEQNQLLHAAHQQQRRKKSAYDRPYESCSESSAKETMNHSTLRGNSTFRFGTHRKSSLLSGLQESKRIDGYSSESQLTSIRSRSSNITNGNVSDSNTNHQRLSSRPSENLSPNGSTFRLVSKDSDKNTSGGNNSILLLSKKKQSSAISYTSDDNDDEMVAFKSTSELAKEFSKTKRGGGATDRIAQNNRMLNQDLSVVSEQSLVAESSTVMNKEPSGTKKQTLNTSLVLPTPIFGNVSAQQESRNTSGEDNQVQGSRLFAPRSANVGQAIESDQKIVGRSKNVEVGGEEMREEKERKRATKIPWYNTKEVEAADKLEKERNIKNQNDMMSNPKVQAIVSFPQPALRIKNSKPTGVFQFESEDDVAEEGGSVAGGKSQTKKEFQVQVHKEDDLRNGVEKHRSVITSTLTVNPEKTKKKFFTRLQPTLQKMEEVEDSHVVNQSHADQQENSFDTHTSSHQDDHLNDSVAVARRQIIKSYFNKK